jgi:glycosyltransferase involved in cell wall biosynthesis
MSIVALEAGIAGTPVLLTDCCGFSEVAYCGGGKVVPATVEGLHKGLSEMINNQGNLKIMGENLKKYVKEHFTWDVISAKYVKLYQGILDKR